MSLQKPSAGRWPASSQEAPLAEGGKPQFKDFQGHCIAEVSSCLLSRPQLQQTEMMGDGRTNLRASGHGTKENQGSALLEEMRRVEGNEHVLGLYHGLVTFHITLHSIHLVHLKCPHSASVMVHLFANQVRPWYLLVRSNASLDVIVKEFRCD